MQTKLIHNVISNAVQHVLGQLIPLVSFRKKDSFYIKPVLAVKYHTFVIEIIGNIGFDIFLHIDNNNLKKIIESVANDTYFIDDCTNIEIMKEILNMIAGNTLENIKKFGYNCDISIPYYKPEITDVIENIDYSNIYTNLFGFYIGIKYNKI